MNSIFAYDFMIRAFVAAMLISLAAPCIGTTIVLKRLSAIGDATSHSALAGIAAGLIMGFDPVIGAVVFAAAAVLGIEAVRRRFKNYSELATVIVMSAGIGLTAVLSGFVGGGTDLNSFMFGSVVAVSDFDMVFTAVLSIAAVAAAMLLYRELFYTAFDEEAAELAGVPVKTVNMIIMLLTAVTVSAASRIVGALMVSSLLVIPTACAILAAKSYRGTMILSVIFAELFTICGLFASFYLDVKPGGSIVLIGVAVLVVMLIFSKRAGDR